MSTHEAFTVMSQFDLAVGKRVALIMNQCNVPENMYVSYEEWNSLANAIGADSILAKKYFVRFPKLHEVVSIS